MTYETWRSMIDHLITGKITLLRQEGWAVRDTNQTISPKEATERLSSSVIFMAEELARTSGFETFGVGFIFQGDDIEVEPLGSASPFLMSTAPWVHYTTEQCVKAYGNDLNQFKQMALSHAQQTRSVLVSQFEAGM